MLSVINFIFKQMKCNNTNNNRGANLTTYTIDSGAFSCQKNTKQLNKNSKKLQNSDNNNNNADDYDYYSRHSF